MIHIACNIDANFTRHCAVTLVSLFHNNRESRFCVHIVTDYLPQGDRDILTDLAARTGNEVHFYVPESDLLQGFSIRAAEGRISMAAYYRCMLSSILPSTLEKVLYMDCDIIVETSIAELWNTDITEYAVACVEDIGSNEAERYQRLCYDSKYKYFNSGVLLINLNYWRQHQVDRQCITYFHTYPERIRFNDQDLLNAVLYQHTLYIPLKWNMQDGFYRYGMDRKAPNPEAYRQELLHPAILHYTNKKPWHYDSMHPLRGEYFTYLDMTPWKGGRPLSSFTARLKRGFKMIPYLTGLRHPKYISLYE
ncbi:MAG: glycosyltransferase family 8 protein [Mediterranea sp.]|jgi:lipopolysaccharide biosynthesis glycosyltransferase|nr:glycosyltransferase family 8 protein [Mediterranea sp.]